MNPRPQALILFEQSGIVRDAFTTQGFIAASADLSPSARPGIHWCGDWRDCPWLTTAQLIIAHPPCTYLCSAGAHQWQKNAWEQQTAYFRVREVASLPAPFIAIENPRGALTRLWRAPDQYIEPHWFGDNRTKKTGLWLKGLPLLSPTELFNPEPPRRWMDNMANTKQRTRRRSETSPAIAAAMADQWGGVLRQFALLMADIL